MKSTMIDLPAHGHDDDCKTDDSVVSLKVEHFKERSLKMSVHIQAKQGDIAETILLPGDPLRAKHIAETYLEDVVQYNDVRNMFGYTGTYKGQRISVQGTGMGVPSISIYITELMEEYDVQNLIRVGTCGAVRDDVHVRDVIIGQSASTNSSIVNNFFPNVSFAPTADFTLLHTAYEEAMKKQLPVKVGNVYTEDFFYNEHAPHETLARYGVLGVEMETAALYLLASQYGRRALSILTVSDHIKRQEVTTPEERQTTFNDMVEIALETALQMK